jgi:Chaperone of endosialidase
MQAAAVAGNNTLTLPTQTGNLLADNGSGALTIQTINSGSGNALTLQSNSTTALYIDTSQNVGIGTTSPAVKLDLNSTVATVANLNSTNANGPGLRFTSSGTANGYVGSAKYIVSGALADFGIDVSGANNLIFGTNDVERARIDSSGNLLVGTTSNTGGFKLNVLGKIGLQTSSIGGVAMEPGGASNSGYVSFWDTTYTTRLGYIGYATIGSGGGGMVISSESSTNALTFNAAGSERMRIDTSGNLLVGTTSNNTGERFKVLGPGAASSEIARFENSTNTSGYSAIVSSIQQNGNNTSTWHFRGNTNNVANWYLYGNGTTSYSSDARLKKNIETTRDGYLEDLCKLRVVKYNWKDDAEGKPKELGLIAQEVEQVFAGLVQDDPSKISETDNTIYKQLKGSVLPFMLLKALQEAVAKIDAQAADIAALKAKVGV